MTNFKLDIGEESANQYWPVAYALVYVPEGYNVNNLTFPAVTDDMYNPTKMVIISGVCNSAGNEDHKKLKILKKMCSGRQNSSNPNHNKTIRNSTNKL